MIGQIRSLAIPATQRSCMMGEPLFDEISAAIVVSGVAAIIVLRSALAETANVDRRRQLSVIGHLLLGIAVSFLLYRWAAAVMSLPTAIRPNVWHSGALSVACGIGLVAAVKSIIGQNFSSQVRHFLIAAICGVLALFIAALWEWALLLLTLLVGGVALAVWRVNNSNSLVTYCRPTPCGSVDSQMSMNPPGHKGLGYRDSELPLGTPVRISKGEAHESTSDHPSDVRPREPALVLFVSAALLLLLLGTWQHVIEHESQRKTRSPRYSAWPRATALRSAWERSDWILKPDDANSALRVADAASREQRVALGLGALLLIVTLATWSGRPHAAADSEVHYAG